MTRQSQKKGVCPNAEKVQINPVKDASFVDLSPSAHPMTNVLNVVEGIPAGVRLQKVWQVLAAKGLSPRVLILKERYSLKIKISHRGTSNKECTCQSPQKQLPEGGIAFPPPKTNCGKCQNPVLPGVLQPTCSCSQAQAKVVIHLGPQYLKSALKDQNFQKWNTRINQAVPSKGEWVTSPMPTFTSQMKLYPIPLLEPKFLLSDSFLWLIHSSNVIYHSGQGDQAHAPGKEYMDPPVPRLLVGQGTRHSYLDTQILLTLFQDLGQVFNFVVYQ